MAHQQAIAAFFRAIAAGRLPDDDMAADFSAWTPTSGETDAARFAGGVAMLSTLFEDDFEYHIDRVIEQGDAAAAQVRSTGTFSDGTPYAQHHVFLFDFVDGRISRVAEYMNTLITKEAVIPRLMALAAGQRSADP